MQLVSNMSIYIYIYIYEESIPHLEHSFFPRQIGPSATDSTIWRTSACMHAARTSVTSHALNWTWREKNTHKIHPGLWSKYTWLRTTPSASLFSALGARKYDRILPSDARMNRGKNVKTDVFTRRENIRIRFCSSFIGLRPSTYSNEGTRSWNPS